MPVGPALLQKPTKCAHVRSKNGLGVLLRKEFIDHKVQSEV